jgi:hypothetical protein
MTKSRRLLDGPRQSVELYLPRSAVLWAFCRANHQFEFQKRTQLIIRAHNETLSVVAAIMVSIGRLIGGYKPPFPISKKQSAFHPRAQRNGFHRPDARLQSKLFARWNQTAETQPKLQPRLLRLSAIIPQYLTGPDSAAFASEPCRHCRDHRLQG